MENTGIEIEKAGKANVSFREALRGYNKKDVNAYLEEMNLRFASAEENYKRTIANQRQTIEALEFKVETYDLLNAELENVKKTLAEKEKLLEENAKKIAQYERQIGVQNQQIAKYEEEKLNLERKLSQVIDEKANLAEANQILRDRLEEGEKIVSQQAAQLEMLSAENERLRESAKAASERQVGEDLPRKVGEVLIIAKEEADKMKEKASAEAEQIKAEAQEEAKRIIEQTKEEILVMREEARAKLEDALEQANKKLVAMSEEYVKGYTEYLRSVQGEFDEIIDKMREKSREINGRVESLRDIISEELKREYSRIDSEMDDDTGTATIPESEFAFGADIEDEKI